MRISDWSSDVCSSDLLTLPKLLRAQGYTNALIGKMHLTGTDLGTAPNLPYGHQTMWKLGWDYFDGYLDGATYPIDKRAGRSTVAEGTHTRGFGANNKDGKRVGAGKSEAVTLMPGGE